METDIVASESTLRAQASVEKLDKTVKGFRDQIKNDLASMKAASERVQNEVNQMDAKYRKAAELLTSKEFEHAIANAERMAIALKAISELQQTQLSFAVFNGGSVKQ